MRTEQEILDTIIRIANENDHIRAAYMHGSRANPNAEKDNYSDYDIVFVVTETDSFTGNNEWLNIFGELAFSFEGHKNQNMFYTKKINDLTRRFSLGMMFKDGNHIDLVIEIIEEAMNHNQIKNKPVIILLDKDGCLFETAPICNESLYIKKPCEDEYISCCSGFWWFLSYVAIGIARNQLPYAREFLTSHNSSILNRMIEWYIGIQTDFSVGLGRDNRYYKKYLPTDIYDLYLQTHSDCDSENLWNAIFIACELFNKTASSVAAFLGFIYNKQEEENMKDYLVNIKNGII